MPQSDGVLMPTKALIPAAGRGVRAYPKTTHLSKVMLEIDGIPIIERNVNLLRDQLGIRDIVIIIGYMGDQIRSYLGNGERHGVRISYIACPNPDVGLARGILLT